MTALLSTSDFAQIVLASLIILSLVKPLLELAVPAFSPSAKSHDPLLIALSFLLCLGAVLGTAATRNELSVANILPTIIATIQQFAGSQTVYMILTKMGLSVNLISWASGLLSSSSSSSSSSGNAAASASASTSEPAASSATTATTSNTGGGL